MNEPQRKCETKKGGAKNESEKKVVDEEPQQIPEYTERLLLHCRVH